MVLVNLNFGGKKFKSKNINKEINLFREIRLYYNSNGNMDGAPNSKGCTIPTRIDETPTKATKATLCPALFITNGSYVL